VIAYPANAHTNNMGNAHAERMTGLTNAVKPRDIDTRLCNRKHPGIIIHAINHMIWEDYNMENNDEKYTIKMTDTFTVSSDEDERKDKQGTAVTVTFVFTDWTAQDFADRLMVSNSPRVAVQAILRKMKIIPTTYTYIVPKAGTRSGVRTVNYEAALVAAMGAEKAKVLINKFGSAEAAIKALESIM
jgi:flagellar hook-associated protein FlgK